MDLIHNAEKLAIKLSALVYHLTLELLLVVAQNVLSVLNVPKIKHVQTKNVSTLAPILADKMPSVESIITAPFVIAWMDILVIHLPNVILYHVRLTHISLWTLSHVVSLTVLAPVIQEDPYRDPCNPSPCGPYSQCRDFNGSPSCSCLSSYIGAPPNCKPECVINSECPSNQACINEKCRDPCPGSCGADANCFVMNHTPVCTCPDGYTGDPFTYCHPKPVSRKSFSIVIIWILLIHPLFDYLNINCQKLKFILEW